MCSSVLQSQLLHKQKAIFVPSLNQERSSFRRPCKSLELQNGRVDLTDFRFGATANFSCSEGCRLIGPTCAPWISSTVCPWGISRGMDMWLDLCCTTLIPSFLVTNTALHKLRGPLCAAASLG
ncbi:unnamed protein product [Caretta caretta]